jgi:hypothetical protein
MLRSPLDNRLDPLLAPNRPEIFDAKFSSVPAAEIVPILEGEWCEFELCGTKWEPRRFIEDRAF